VVLDGDPCVSRVHATLERVAGVWTIDDNGLSRNGTFVNGRRVSGRLQLHDRDEIGDERHYATPATNQQISEELFLSVDVVKTHLRALFHLLGIEHLQQNHKRTRLVEMALEYGLVSSHDL
jgi:pSer/pThr/pTyr-binding forkhead associated (FHA) protein